MNRLRLALLILAIVSFNGVARAASDRTEATRAVARPFLERMFVQNDVRGAYDTYAAPDFIQHNPRMANGLAGHRAYFEGLAKQATGRPANWAHVFDMVLVDGDLFAVYHHVFASPEDRGRVFVDIWRVADGKIAEHWDIIQDVPATSANNNSMACGAGDNYEHAKALGNTLDHPTCGAPDPASSRKTSRDVIDAYLKDVRSRDVAAAIRRWFSADYRQHSPTIPDGAEGAITYLEHEYGKAVQVIPTLGPARVIADGDYVLFHRLVTYPGKTRPSSNIDVFRVTRGKVSEHWDLKQPVPETSANQNGMW